MLPMLSLTLTSILTSASPGKFISHDAWRSLRCWCRITCQSWPEAICLKWSILSPESQLEGSLSRHGLVLCPLAGLIKTPPCLTLVLSFSTTVAPAFQCCLANCS